MVSAQWPAPTSVYVIKCFNACEKFSRKGFLKWFDDIDPFFVDNQLNIWRVIWSVIERKFLHVMMNI